MARTRTGDSNLRGRACNHVFWSNGWRGITNLTVTGIIPVCKIELVNCSLFLLPEFWPMTAYLTQSIKRIERRQLDGRSVFLTPNRQNAIH
jgi:hypothetical protein